MKKVFIYVSACDLRFLDANRVKEYFLKNNYKIAYNPEEADLIFFIACAALNSIAKGTLQKVKEFQNYKAELIVAGCLPEIEKEELSNIFNGKTIVTKNLEKIDELFPDHKVKFSSIDDSNIQFRNYYQNDFTGERTTYLPLKKIFWKNRFLSNNYKKIRRHILTNLTSNFERRVIEYLYSPKDLFQIRVGWGCLGNCHYCAVKMGIGNLRSKPIDVWLKEFKKGLEKGYKNIVINADDTGVYGLDIKSSLPELLDKLTNIPGDYKLLVSSIHPQWLVKYVDELEEIIKRKKIIIIESTIQSGSSRILKLMNRYSDVEKMKDAYLKIKNTNPKLKLFTHIIAGFPTETDEEFRMSLDFIKAVDFDAGFVFPFSCKSGTKAEEIEPKVSEKDIAKRIKFSKKFLRKQKYNIFRLKKHFYIFDK